MLKFQRFCIINVLVFTHYNVAYYITFCYNILLFANVKPYKVGLVYILSHLVSIFYFLGFWIEDIMSDNFNRLSLGAGKNITKSRFISTMLLQ